MKLTIAGFGGELPRVAAHLLPNNAAQVAANVTLSSGDMKSQLGLSAEVKKAGGLTNPTGAFFTDDGNFFVWTDERSAAKSAVIGDFFQRVYFVDGTAYLRATQQFAPRAGIGVWDASVTYASGNEATYPGVVPANWSGATTYARGDLRCRPNAVSAYPNHNIIYRSLRDANLNHDPASSTGWWELYGAGTRYISLANANTAKTPTEEPTWWRPNGYSLIGSITRAGVPAPENWPTKSGSTYLVNVVTGDEQGLLDVYHVPQSAADARAAADAATPSSALIAIARSTLLDNIIVKASATDNADTASVYYGSDSTKVQENVVPLLQIERGRLYAFNPPEKQSSLSEYVVTQIWVEEGSIDETPIIEPVSGA